MDGDSDNESWGSTSNDFDIDEEEFKKYQEQFRNSK